MTNEDGIWLCPRPHGDYGDRLLSAGVLLLGLSAGCLSSPTSPSASGTSPAPSSVEAGCPPPTYHTASNALDALQDHFRPVLQANKLEFEGQTGPVQAFGAGSIYPQVWLRDSATLIPATRYFYPREHLTSWLEEHLSHQGSDGELWDWVAAGTPDLFTDSAPRARQVFGANGVFLTADKNTTASDQEASAADAAGSIFSLTGDRNWLRKPIGGRALIDRLDAALTSVLAHRIDEGTGLVTSAFTADWGDVSPTHADQRAIYLDELTPVVGGLYASALFSRAADQLAALHEALDDTRRADQWHRTADAIRLQINRYLWQEDRGFYRIHRVVIARGAAGSFDDSDLFAMGGNALAILSGAADARQAARIFAVADERRRQAGLSSVAAVLLPPYPTGFFRHPILTEAFTYQNGGQWDWWSGRLLLAMFQQGHSDLAIAQLLVVAQRVAHAGGLYEWYSRDDVGQGSDRYAGNVGALAGALYQGLFGLDSRSNGLDLTVRLGLVPGSVQVCEPAMGRHTTYVYSFAPGSQRARLKFESDAPGRGRLAVRIPGPGVLEDVRLDGRPLSYEVTTLGQDRYVALVTDWAPHELVIQLR